MIYFLTHAVERTPVHAGLWRNVKAYARKLDAQIRVHLGLYKNRNNPYEADPAKEAWWDPAFTGYDVAGMLRLNSNAAFAADVRIVPTAQNPLSGLQLHGGHASVIFPHTRQHLRTYPAGNSKYAKVHATTGAVTLPNYSDTKLGIKAHDHHIHGFMIVEVVDDKIFHVRNVNARSSDGAFVDSARGFLVSDGKVSEAPPAQCLRIGDSHAHEQDEQAIRAVIDIRETNEPARVIVDDIYSHSVAGHRVERDGWRFKARAHRAGKTVSDELTEAFELMHRLGATDVMHSNHHDHLDEWLANVDARHDPANVLMWAALLGSVAMTDRPAIECAAEWHTWAARPRFWRRGERCVIDGVRHDHGHEGFGGARGTASQWHKAGCKVTTAHAHSEIIRDGHYQVGHTSDASKHHYADETKSNWSQSVIVQDCLGKRQLIRLIDGEYLLS